VWRYLRLFSHRCLLLQVRSYMLCYLRLFSHRRLPFQTLRTLSASQAGGAHGALYPAGRPNRATFSGPKPLASSSSAGKPSATPPQARTSKSGVTILLSSKAGGRADLGIPRSMRPSSGSASSLMQSSAARSRATSRARKSLLMVLSEGSTGPEHLTCSCASSRLSPYPLLSLCLLLTGTLNSLRLSAQLWPAHTGPS
jgi:hypothetical protein